MARKPKVPQSASIFSLLPDWQRELRANHYPESTIGEYQRRLRYFCAWLAPDGLPEHCTTRVDEVDKAILQDYFTHLYATVSENTVKSRHIALSSFFRFCIGFDELPSGINPVRRYVKAPNPPPIPTHVLADHEVRAILATCERGKDFYAIRDHAILRTFLAGGMRIAELQALKLTDVHLDQGLVLIQRGKGGAPREVGIGVKTVRALGQYIHKRARHRDAHLAALWLGKQGTITTAGIRHVVKHRARQAGLDLHPHQFRHLFAHTYLQEGGQETALLQLAGWKNAKMLERYGASLAKQRAIDEHHRLGIGEKW